MLHITVRNAKIHERRRDKRRRDEPHRLKTVAEPSADELTRTVCYKSAGHRKRCGGAAEIFVGDDRRDHRSVVDPCQIAYKIDN